MIFWRRNSLLPLRGQIFGAVSRDSRGGGGGGGIVGAFAAAVDRHLPRISH